MAIEITESHELIGVIETFPPINSYWLDLCFPRVHLSNTEFIDFDIVDKGRRLAPFVAPTVQGQPMVSRGHSVRKFKPAYVKPKDPVDPGRLLTRRAGELFGSPLTPQQRYDAIVGDILADHNEGIQRRWEWMAAKAAIDGAVTIVGENYPMVNLAFGRHADHTKTLTTTARWSQSTSTPLTDIENWNQEMMSRDGYPIARITMSPTAWGYFINHEQVKDMLNVLRGGTTNLELGPGNAANPSQYRGTLKSANIDIYVYSDSYEDNQGAQVKMLDDDDIVLTSANVAGVRAFGAIMDKKADWQAVPIFPKMWEQEDPSGVFVMTQSAPLMIPGRPNGTMKVSVNG